MWREIGSFQGLGEWHPMPVGAAGDVSSRAHDAWRHRPRVSGRYRYAMESSQLPVSGYVGEFGVQPAGDATSTVVWSSDFGITSRDVDTEAMIEGFLVAGLDALGERYR